MAREIALHMYNLSYPQFQPAYKRKMAAAGGLSVAQVGAYHKSTAEQVVAAARNAVGADRVSVMRMMSHGNSGIFFFPGMWNYYLTSVKYADLRSIFAPLARLEIHGCGVASESDVLKPGANPHSPRASDAVPGTFTGNRKGAGLVYLKRVASIFNLPSTGAIDVQPDNSWSYRGDTVTAFPFSEKFAMDSEGTRIWDLEALGRAAEQFRHFILKEYAFKGRYQEAIRQLRELISRYPRTPAAEWARTHLTIEALKSGLLLADD